MRTLSLIRTPSQVFYHSLPADGHDFIMKDKYSLGLTIFNVLVYLLLMADVIATPLVKDEKEQVSSAQRLKAYRGYIRHGVSITLWEFIWGF